MARIRSVKPDFFLDFELSKLTPITRLFFIGLWTQADKAGRMEDEPHKLKVQIIPWDDDIDVEKILSDLAPKFITRYKTKSGEKYLQINAWHHQKPHHTERETVIPPPLTVKKRLKNGSLTRRKGGEEDKDKDSLERRIESVDTVSPILTLWNDMASKSSGVFPVVIDMTSTRSSKCKERLKKIPPESWPVVMEKIRASPFCRGEVPDKEGRVWRVTFDWIIKNDQNVLKVLEGNYDERRQSNDGNAAAYVPGKYSHLSKVSKTSEDLGQKR